MNIHEVRIRNLSCLIKERFNDNVSAFARAIDRSSSQINDTLAGRKSFGEKVARDIEKKLGLSFGYLDSPDLVEPDGVVTRSFFVPKPTPQSNVSPGPNISGTVPLISWVQAGAFCQAPDLFQPGDAEDWVPCVQKLGPHAYALRVVGDSMTAPYGRSYPEGCIIFVDPDCPITNGCRVVAKLPDTDEATFKVYSEDAGKKYLKPLNPQYPITEINDSMMLCGVVKGYYMPE